MKKNLATVMILVLSLTAIMSVNTSANCITEQEMQMYENGEMAPMAYTYLMDLTYQWYLTDNTAEKTKLQKLADDFRATEYKTTNGASPKVDAGIEFMPAPPTGDITMQQHFFRNELNLQFSWETFQTLNKNLPEHLKWKELPFEQSVFHKFGQINNRKYVSACEHFEVVYTKENYLVDKDFSATNMGTYNYFGPAQPSNHTYFDVLPWALWGNTEETEEVTEEITEEPEEEDFWTFWSSLFNFEALIQAFM